MVGCINKDGLLFYWGKHFLLFSKPVWRESGWCVHFGSNSLPGQTLPQVLVPFFYRIPPTCCSTLWAHFANSAFLLNAVPLSVNGPHGRAFVFLGSITSVPQGLYGTLGLLFLLNSFKHSCKRGYFTTLWNFLVTVSFWRPKARQFFVSILLSRLME